MKIMIFHGGSIGDTLMALPAIQCIRDNYPDAVIDLFSCPGVNDFSYLNFYEHTGLVDHIERFFIPPGLAARLPVYGRIFLTARRRHYDLVVCLLPWHRNHTLDRAFFRLAGAGKVIYPIILPARKDITLPRVPVLMLRGLKELGLKVPSETEIAIDLHLTPEERETAAEWFRRLDVPTEAIPVAVGMGGKKPVCRWPVAKYREVLRELCARHRVYPVFFGGPGDAAEARSLIAELGCGNFAADGGKLTLRETVAALTPFRLFIGNDTGTVHLAAAAGLPIVGLYSAHNYNGLWHPLGENNRILRQEIECAGCDLLNCAKGDPAVCLDRIEPAEVIAAAVSLLPPA